MSIDRFTTMSLVVSVIASPSLREMNGQPSPMYIAIVFIDSVARYVSLPYYYEPTAIREVMQRFINEYCPEPPADVELDQLVTDAIDMTMPNDTIETPF